MNAKGLYALIWFCLILPLTLLQGCVASSERSWDNPLDPNGEACNNICGRCDTDTSQGVPGESCGIW